MVVFWSKSQVALPILSISYCISTYHAVWLHKCPPSSSTSLKFSRRWKLEGKKHSPEIRRSGCCFSVVARRTGFGFPCLPSWIRYDIAPYIALTSLVSANHNIWPQSTEQTFLVAAAPATQLQFISLLSSSWTKALRLAHKLIFLDWLCFPFYLTVFNM